MPCRQAVATGRAVARAAAADSRIHGGIGGLVRASLIEAIIGRTAQHWLIAIERHEGGTCI